MKAFKKLISGKEEDKEYQEQLLKIKKLVRRANDTYRYCFSLFEQNAALNDKEQQLHRVSIQFMMACLVISGKEDNQENIKVKALIKSMDERSRASAQHQLDLSTYANATFRIPMDSFLQCLSSIENSEAKRKQLFADLERSKQNLVRITKKESSIQVETAKLNVRLAEESYFYYSSRLSQGITSINETHSLTMFNTCLEAQFKSHLQYLKESMFTIDILDSQLVEHKKDYNNDEELGKLFKEFRALSITHNEPTELEEKFANRRNQK